MNDNIPLYKRIGSYILESDFEIGDQIPTEPELCSRFECSRNKLREALQVLNGFGIITIKHGAGMFVSELNLNPISEILGFFGAARSKNDPAFYRMLLDLRKGVDLGFAQQMCKAANEHNCAPIYEICEQMYRAKDSQEFLLADRRFHLAMYKLVENELAEQVSLVFWDVLQSLKGAISNHSEQERQQNALKHRAIVDAAVNSYVDEYRAAVSYHYRHAYEVIEAWMGRL